jgi:RNA polymerase sigma factor (sigma-70 family)
VILDEHLFRREAARLLATLTRILGVHQLALAEDLVQDTLTTALEVWTFRGVPDNPSAWLTTAAKNRALSALRRQRTADKHAPELSRAWDREGAEASALDADFLPEALRDDELRMMFTCCHPRLDEPTQVALVLYLLGGFSVREVASAFLVSHAAMEKRISRGKKALEKTRGLFELTAQDFLPRLSAVHRALYLLFSEGYHAASPDDVVRVELCREAIRLVRRLLEHPPAATPATFALAALMDLGAARLPGRLDAAGDLTLLYEQDRTRWDPALIARGMAALDASAQGQVVTSYHLEAGIAALHAAASSVETTRWADIVGLYDALYALAPSPVVALNRAVAVGQLEGPERGLVALLGIVDAERLEAYPFYPAARAELELRSGRPEVARRFFTAALARARNEAERRFLERRKLACDVPS